MRRRRARKHPLDQATARQRAFAWGDVLAALPRLPRMTELNVDSLEVRAVTQ
ncbi:MAG: hypothetical protein H6828_08065 [Planctomycetes bacterium]|nr:hypothetical protein [Planctomycetota bacterium]